MWYVVVIPVLTIGFDACVLVCISQEKQYTHCFFDRDTGAWLKLPLGWELHHEMIRNMVNQIMVRNVLGMIRTIFNYVIVRNKLCTS